MTLQDEARALLAAATPAPWRAGVAAPCHTGVWGTQPEANWNVCLTGDELTKYSAEDAALIARAPELLAALCDKLDEAEKTLVEIQPDPVLVGDSWIPVGDLPTVCANFMASSEEYSSEAKAAITRAKKAEAAIERVRALHHAVVAYADFEQTTGRRECSCGKSDCPTAAALDGE